MSIPIKVLSLARRQHNALSRRQAREHMSEHAYQGLLRRGRLVSLHHGVVAIAGGASPPQQAMMAATLRVGRGARVTGPAVLGLFDVDGFTPRDPFTVLVPAKRMLSPVDFAVQVDPLPDVDVATFDHIPIATLPLAFLDAVAALAGDTRQDRRLRVALDSACRAKRMKRGQLLDRALQLGPDHPGAAWVIDLEAGGGLRADSEREREVTTLMDAVRPRPEVQVHLTPRIRPDYLWRRLKLVGEYLGWVDHAPDNPADDRRFAAIRELGYEILTITARDLRDPDALVERIQLTLVRRARELGVPLD